MLRANAMLALLLPALMVAAAPQATPFVITATTMEWKSARPVLDEWLRTEWAKGSIVMPYLSGGDARAAARINESLFLQAIQAPAPTSLGPTFELPDKVEPDGLAKVEFKVRRNDGRIVALDIELEGCSAYCEEYARHYNFDARTGWQINTLDLLTRPGLVALGHQMARERMRRYAEQTTELKQRRKSAPKGKKGAEEVSDLDDRIGMNRECRHQAEEGDREAPQRLVEQSRFLGLSLASAQAMVFTAARCSPHGTRALDDVDEVTLTVPLSGPVDAAEAAQPEQTFPGRFLTAYGRSLLLGDGAESPPATPYGQVLHGKLGKRIVTVWLDRPQFDDSLEGLYYYDKFRVPIELSGQRRGAKLELREITNGGGQATMTLQQTGRGLKGNWSGGDRTIPVDLSW